MQFDLEPLDLAAWLPEHPRLWSGHPRRRDVRTVVSGTDLSVQTHPALLGQSCDNLLDNAFKYSADGSPVFVRSWPDAGCVALAVEDRGSGIAASDLPHVIKPFDRSDSARPGVACVGLGLWVVQRIARAFGGHISAMSDRAKARLFRPRAARHSRRVPTEDPNVGSGIDTNVTRAGEDVPWQSIARTIQHAEVDTHGRSEPKGATAAPVFETGPGIAQDFYEHRVAYRGRAACPNLPR